MVHKMKAGNKEEAENPLNTRQLAPNLLIYIVGS